MIIIKVDSDRFVREVIEGNEYSFLFKDLVVVDLGCNVGTFSFWIYKLAREIHAIDMVPDNIKSLNESIARNKMDKIRTYCMAVTGNNLPRRYRKDPELGGGTSQIEEGGQYLTDCVTLGQFMSANKIDYIDILKIDIEGLEREVLSASDFPKDKIGTIIGELHKSRYDGRRIEVKDVLENWGYRYSEPKRNLFLARKI